MPTLALTDLTLSHFRSHLAARLSAGPGAVALFGPNGAGKTNVLEAISLLSPGRGLRRAAAAEMVRRPEALGWKVAADIATHERAHRLVLQSGPEGPRGVEIDGKPAPQAALGRILRVLWLVPAMDRLWSEAAEGRRRFLDRMALSFLPDHGQAVLDYERAMRERNRLFRDGHDNPRWFAALEARMAEAGATVMANRDETVRRLAAAMAAAPTVFPAATLRHEDASPRDAAGLADALARGRPRDAAAGRSIVGPHRADLAALYAEKDVPAGDCSTGEQKALLISVVLANARALADETGAPPILLLDEVSAHLDADRRAALYDEVTALGGQAWMTGTGRELFESLGDRATYLHVTESGGTSRIDPE